MSRNPNQPIGKLDVMETHFVDGHLEPSIDFDYDAVEDRGNPLTAELERSQSSENAAEAFERLLGWSWVDGRGSTRTLEGAFLRFVVLSAVVNPDLVCGLSYEEIGQQLGCGKANVCRLAVEFQDQFGVHFRRSRRHGARNVFSRARKSSFLKRNQPS